MDPMDEDPDGGNPVPSLPPPTPGGPNPAPAHSSSSAATPSSASAAGPASQHTGVSKRRRGLGVVTPNACTECRKKRAKCDGQRPCGRCKAQKDVECIYEIPVRQSKENLRHEIEQLRKAQRSSDQVFTALTRSDHWEDVLKRLRNGQSVEDVSEWLHSLHSQQGAGALPPISRIMGTAGVGYGSAPPRGMTGFPAGSSTGYMPLPSTYHAVSPVSSQAPYSIHPEDHQSPWGGHFSTQSHTTRSGSVPDIMNWSSSDTIRPPQSRVGSWIESQGSSADPTRFRGLDSVLAPDFPEMRVPTATWTNITSDPALVQHLLALYFCWEYPTFASLSKEHFLRDFTDGRPRFCSSILVNALLALGCRFSSKPNTRANPDDPHTSGDHFFKECQRLFYQETNHHSLTTIQALGIMSIREASCGRDSESWYYAGQSIRLAIEMGLHRLEDNGRDDDLAAVQAATFWGAFALDHAWSLATGSLPQCSCFPRLPPKPAIIDDIEASLWIPYTDDGKGIAITGPPTTDGRLNSTSGTPLERSCEQPSNVRSVYKCFCELSELVHQSLYIMHSPGRPLTSKDLLTIYTQYLDWYDRIPEVLRLGHNFTPAVLFAHMYYHFAILLLFRPLIKLRIIGSGVSPRDVCSQAADAISGLLRSYSQLYTLRRTPSFVPYFVLTSSIMHLAIGAARSEERNRGVEGGSSSNQSVGRAVQIDPRVADALSRGIADLTEMAPCHHFAEQALNILQFLAKKWNINVEIEAAEANIPEDPDLAESSIRPSTSSLNFFAPDFSESDFNCTWGEANGTALDTEKGQEDKPAGAEHIASSLENPLFWPFPMQGRPILASGKELEEAGFEAL
ncbi:fungal-specific transcription factor domain-containing protein [Triangularia setosa]|uniref:Fungal-specific transcription factor domain-containing protein n=1 Tax=Triangularia setosa TaxID=2587417 RepID=A0AAN6WA96_9PEZI|nr:fungal-specific transcription factor domain-containing protein [Podospora setosa]